MWEARRGKEEMKDRLALLSDDRMAGVWYEWCLIYVKRPM